MIKRIVIATVAASLIVSVGFGQMKYSRSKSSAASPTPTPSPTVAPTSGRMQTKASPTPLQRTMQTANQAQTTSMQPQQMQVKPTPTPLAKMQSTQNPQFIPARKGAATPIPTPIQRTMQTANQAQTTTMQPGQMQMRPTPTPFGKMQSVQSPQVIPARRGAATPTPLPSAMMQKPMTTPIPSRAIAPQRTTAMQMPPSQQAQRQAALPTPPPPKPTPTPVPPPNVQDYLDRQLAKTADRKFHMNVNGGDLALTPFHTWPQKSTGPNSTSTIVSMRSDAGRVYDIEFATTGAQVSGIRISRINGEAVR